MSALADLLSRGQSPWLDYIRRGLIASGELRRMVGSQEITGVTINPTIFEKAIAGSDDYDGALRDLLAREPRLGPAELYERLAVEDVREAADVLRPVFDRTDGADGFVSLEVAPGLAHDTAGTVSEARRLWGEVARPNLLIKVPGTTEGLPAIEQLLAEGINVNVTLLFSLAQYEAVARAYQRGLARASNPGRVASVASVFVSRIDTAVDRALAASAAPGASGLEGKIAIANCRSIYARYREIFHGTDFAPLAARGGRPQRVLWASTSTKDPRYRDTMYVEELVGPETVDTIPPATLAAFEEHGRVRGDTVAEGLPEALRQLSAAKAAGIDLDSICATLQTEGVRLFAESYALLLRSLAAKKESILAGRVDLLTASLGSDRQRVTARLERWRSERIGERLWKRDPTVWPAAAPGDVGDRMGWLELPRSMQVEVDRLLAFAEEVRAEGTRTVVLFGMGGSSLAPDVLRGIFGSRPGFPQLLVLDSTHPDAVTAVQARIDPARTLFLVSSKSGTTTEPNSFYRYFAEVVRRAGRPTGRAFVAITDPGSPLDQLARRDGFREVFLALPTVGGRYAALTMFGLVPAALIGVDVRALLDRAATMAEACGASVPAPDDPGLVLGAILGELALSGRDKLTFLAAGGLAPFPAWVEQLVAESTGKAGRGIVPVVDEPRVSLHHYGPDRLFVEIQDRDAPDAALRAFTDAVEATGAPVVRLRVPDRLAVGEEFFRWEMAVASAGSILGIDPYDQPDVELAKELARQAMAGKSADAGPAEVVTVPAERPGGLGPALAEWLATRRPGDYVAIQAYLAPSAETSEALERLRRGLLERLDSATTLGYGPRFLHSTGQLHKGGPNTGLFLQLVDSPGRDVPIPGGPDTFGGLIRAQSLGDYRALRQNGRRVLRVDLGADVAGGLRRITEALRG
jgi:transaldolase / glucose-6-phosphate isomerase